VKMILVPLEFSFSAIVLIVLPLRIILILILCQLYPAVLDGKLQS
jgi:hypothetical protein